MIIKKKQKPEIKEQIPEEVQEEVVEEKEPTLEDELAKSGTDLFDLDNIDFSQRQENRRGERRRGYRRVDDRNLVSRAQEEAEQIKEKRVTVKFIILKGYNDSIKDIFDWFVFCKDLGVKKLAVDVDINWFKETNGMLPYHVFDMICFVKTMAEKNFITLDLYDRANMIYQSRKTDKKW